MLDQDFPTGAILRQEMMVLLRVPLKICGQIVFSQMTDRLLISGRPLVAFFLLNGGAELPVLTLGREARTVLLASPLCRAKTPPSLRQRRMLCSLTSFSVLPLRHHLQHRAPRGLADGGRLKTNLCTSRNDQRHISDLHRRHEPTPPSTDLLPLTAPSTP